MNRLHQGALILLLATGALLAAPTGPAQAAKAHQAAWKRFVLGPDSRFVEPVKVRATSGSVTGAKALLRGAGGVARLTMEQGGAQPVVVLDFGRAVSGIPRIEVSRVNGSPTLRASFSESGRYIDADGDNGGNGPCCGAAPPAAEPFRWNEWEPAGPGVLKTAYLQGSQRFVRIALTSPGTVELRGVDLDFKALRARPSDYRGWFLSSDHLLNRIWYAGAYTAQLNMVPPGAQGGNRRPQVVDGAKRDRSIWSGDLVVQNPVIWNTLGKPGSEYVKQSLLTLAEGADPSGALPGIRTLNGGGFIYSETYSMHAANTMVDYFRYTGDRGYARRALPLVRAQLEFIGGLTDERGLLVSRPGSGPGLCCGMDWNGPYDGPKTGAVTAANVIYFHALKQAAYLEREVGSRQRAAADEASARALRARINAELFDPGSGLYRLSDVEPDEIGQDSNALAVLYGVAPRDRARSILARLKSRLWTPFGTRPFSPGTGFSEVISPFVTGFETGARFAADDGGDALKLMRRLWGRMLRPGPDYSGAFWEKMSPSGGVGVLTGNDPIDNQSLAHGWSAAPTAQLSESVLGVSPVKPGYRSWRVKPDLGSLRWAVGQVPTRFGPITVKWDRRGKGTLLRGRIKAPAGTRGRVVLPVSGAGVRVLVNGRSRGNRAAFMVTGGREKMIRVVARTKARASARRSDRRQCRPHWVSAWSSSPSMAHDTGFENQTIRAVSYTHFGGSKVRVVLTNRFGDRPVTFEAASVGVARGGRGSSSPAIASGRPRQVLFNGRRKVTIKPGADVRSDPVNLRVRRGQSVVTSFFSRAATGRPTIHTEAVQSSYVAAGNQVADGSASSFEKIPDVPFGAAGYFLTRVEVRAKGDAATVVALGDSLTNGTGSSLDGNGRYADALARRLATDRRVSNLAVVNAGIGGNRILRDAADFFPFGGPSALNRLRPDVLSQPGLAGVLLIEGMNDIGSSVLEGTGVTSSDVIRGLKALTRRIHAAGKKVYVGTIPPTGDPGQPSAIPWYSTPEVDRTRREVNAFIRSAKHFDGYFEVDRALRDPLFPARLSARYNSGDGLHPNDLGYRRLARSIRARLLDGLSRCPRRSR